MRTDPPEVFIADSDATLSRVLALKLVARTDPAMLEASGRLDAIRDALLGEQWGDAVFEWMEATGEIVDGYPDELMWTEAALDVEAASMEIRLAPIFDEPSR